MEYVYQIRLHGDTWEPFDRPVAAQGIIERDSKKAVIAWLEDNYPEYFEGGKVVQRLSKSNDRIVYVSIYEIDDYWRDYWTQEVACVVCGRKVPLIELKRNLGHFDKKRFACSTVCAEKQYENALTRDEAFWNERSNYYYIYKIANKDNDKCYIGFTEREPIFRWWEHLRHSTQKFGQELQALGIEHFTFEVLEKRKKSEVSVEEMHEIETKYMLACGSLDNGYNCITSKRGCMNGDQMIIGNEEEL